jgi:hypothetical protein
MNADKFFERELEIFRTDSEAASQYFHAFLSVHDAAREYTKVYELLSGATLFWNTLLSGLQTSSFVALGRVFDQDSVHNLDALIRMAQQNSDCLFSKEALGRRKQAASVEAPDWLENCIRDCYTPTPEDFRQIRKLVDKQRKIYQLRYKALRDKVYAHNAMMNRAETDLLFANTDIREIQSTLEFFSWLYDSLWQLFFNGKRPTFADSYVEPQDGIRIKITDEARRFLAAAAGIPREPEEIVK